MSGKKEILITIERLGVYGEGVGHLDGLTVFVDGALPGEIVRACIYEQKKRYVRAKTVAVIKPSLKRQTPVCAHFGRCGGCQLMHLNYLDQLEAKRQRVVDALTRVGKLSNVQVAKCVASPTPLNYRNKIQLPASNGPMGLTLGLYALESHDLVEINRCHIHCILGEQVFQTLKQLLRKSGLKAYNSQTGEGELRHVLIKTALFTEQLLVVFVTNGSASATLKSLAEEILILHPQVKGVVNNVNISKGNTILGENYRLLAGASTIHEKLCGLSFKVSAASFFQVNPPQAEVLYETALEFAQLSGNEIVLDAYCGVGTMALIFSKQAKEVIGVECVNQAILDARDNATQNKISNTRFHCAKAEEFIGSIQFVDVAILNPPRKGCELRFLERLAHLRPNRIVYVSCDPATLARDLSYLTNAGYDVARIQPFDMFPQTAHVETLALLVLA